MTESEYKAEWKLGFHQSDYNNCRFADDKIKYCKDWIEKHCKIDGKYSNDISKIICEQKIKIAEDLSYRNICSNWSDKIEVNNLLTNLGMQNLIIPVLDCKYNNLTIADLANMSKYDSYIIKCNHGSGWNKIKNKTTSIAAILQEIEKWQKLNYAYIAGYEAQYENIKPGYIIQSILCDKPIDYGFWYIKGELQAISLTKKFGKNLEEYLAFVKPDCTESNWCIGAKPEMGNLSSKFKHIVENLKEFANELAKPFDFVRVDMLYVNGHPYFGEMTFTPCAGKIEIVY